MRAQRYRLDTHLAINTGAARYVIITVEGTKGMDVAFGRKRVMPFAFTNPIWLTPQSSMYPALIRPLLYLLPPEFAHRLAIACLRIAFTITVLRKAMIRRFAVRDERVSANLFGKKISSPIGLAAGFDKDATAFAELSSIGFGFVEVGTLTPKPQSGNRKPRLFRLPKERALINCMGFNNRGAIVAAADLPWPRQECIGVNIGKNKTTDEKDAVTDYEKTAILVGGHADYVVINVSSPNTPGLRDLQAIDKLRSITTRVRVALDAPGQRRVPLLIKISPDLSDDDIDSIATLSNELKIDGIIATNTTTDRKGLKADGICTGENGVGGLSGRPLKQRSLEVLKRLRRTLSRDIVIISVGGIETIDDVWERICLGASFIQIYTAFVYDGPGLPSRLARQLADRVSQHGYKNYAEAIGSTSSPDV